MKLNRKNPRPLRILLEWVLKEFESPIPRPPTSPRAYRSSDTELHEKGEEETPGDCGIERLRRKASGGGGGRYKREKRTWRKKIKEKKGILFAVVWLQANWVLFVMRSRWGPTSATQWQPQTSTTTGEWMVPVSVGQMMANNGERETKCCEMTEKGDRCELKHETKSET